MVFSEQDHVPPIAAARTRQDRGRRTKDVIERRRTGTLLSRRVPGNPGRDKNTIRNHGLRTTSDH
jgi:hypothetical protein